MKYVILAAVCGVTSIAGCTKPENSGVEQRIAEVDAVAPTSKDSKSDYADLLAALPTSKAYVLDEERAVEFARLSLTCVDQEYPNKPSNVVDGDDTVKPPRELHPAFFGCFDWHSAVHGHWAMLRLLKTFSGIPIRGEIRKTLSSHLTPAKIAVELAYYKEKYHDLFERPYGWGWLLRLVAELHTFDDEDAKTWANNLRPLGEHLSGLTRKYLDTLSVPVRAGTHHSTAFALTHIHDYAVAIDDLPLKEAVERRSRDFYESDTDCPTAYEPSGEDFISPCLVEADLMRRVLPKREFVSWLDRFLPRLDSAEFKPVLNPPVVKDRKDPKIGHLIGLALQRGASYNGIAKALPEDDPRRPVFLRLAEVHRDDGLAQMFDSGYGGAHWLASFAIYLLTDSGPY